MINSNVMNVVGEVLESHNIRRLEGEKFPETVARALHVSEDKAELWLDSLAGGCPVETANDRAGITPGENEPLLVAIAKSLGGLAARIAG